MEFETNAGCLGKQGLRRVNLSYWFLSWLIGSTFVVIGEVRSISLLRGMYPLVIIEVFSVELCNAYLLFIACCCPIVASH